MVQVQTASKKESDGNENKLISISNKCNTQTVWKLTSVGGLSKKRALNHFCLKLSKMTVSIATLVCTVFIISKQSMIVYKYF